MYISREIEDLVRKLAVFYPVVTLTGPRQSGNACWASAHPNKSPRIRCWGISREYDDVGGPEVPPQQGRSQ